MSVVISGGGVAGLLLALALKRECGLDATVYEQAPGYEDNVGGAVGLYANGLRVIRDISPELLAAIRSNGRPYRLRRWMRHDGTEIAVGEERYLSNWTSRAEELELATIGIRRWRLQKCLHQECIATGIKIKFGIRINRLVSQDERTGVVTLELSDGKHITADLVFGCDGARSALRGSLFPASEPEYTGVTCLMGAAPIPRQDGICFPSSSTTKCHACYYPTGDNEQIFQIFFLTPEKPESWGALSAEEGKKECEELAARLKADGWDKQFTEPLLQAQSVLRTGLRARTPIPVWHRHRVVLLGDAAHPPVPYIGQGAMMAMEDVGVLTTLLKTLCVSATDGKFSFAHLETCFRLYESLRVPRTTQILENSASLGRMQLMRTAGPNAKEVNEKEESIKRDVAQWGTLPVMKSGASYNYADEVRKVLSDFVVARASGAKL